MPGGRNSPIILSSNENSPSFRCGPRYQATNLPKPRTMSQTERNARDNRVGELMSEANVRRGEGRAAAALWHRVMAFIQEHPRATVAAAEQANVLGLSVVLKRVRKRGTRKAYEWQVRMYRGG